MLKATLLFIVGQAALVLAGAWASAATIPVNNADFSNPTLAPGDYTTYAGPANTIPDWTNPNIAGVQGNNVYAVMPGGSANFAYDDGGTIAQTLTSDLQVGTYVLDVYAGWRNGKSFGGGSIQLSAGSDSLGSQTLVQPATQGTFLLQELTVVVLPGSPDLGQPLSIALNSAGNSVDFSDVSLSFTPEPTSMAVLSVAGVGLLARRRRNA